MTKPFTDLHKIYFVVPVLVTIVVASGCQVHGTSRTKQEKPNIVFLLADDLGWADVNYNDPLDRDFYDTPNIDRLAEQGLQFSQAYASAPNCAPTRASLMSGQYYPRQPVYTVNSGARGKKEHRSLVPARNTRVLPPRYITLAETLKKEGYTNAFMGKWHLGDPPDLGPKQQGFDVNIGGYQAGHPAWNGGYHRPDNNPYIEDATPEDYLTDYLTEKAVQFIQNHQDGPFYLQLSYYTVHRPLQAPRERIETYREKEPDRGHDNPTYAAMIESLDRSVGKIVSTLEQHDLANNTIIVFTSDNGGLGGYHDEGIYWQDITSHEPLRGGKGMLYEGGIRVPLIVRWPKVIQKGTETDEPVITFDFYPTLVEAAGGEKPDEYQLDGVNLMPLFRNSDASLERDRLFWHFPGYLQGREGTWRTTPVSVIRSGSRKLLHFYEGDRWELYNIRRDRSESDNLAETQPVVKQRLRKSLENWLNEIGAPLPEPK